MCIGICVPYVTRATEEGGTFAFLCSLLLSSLGVFLSTESNQQQVWVYFGTGRVENRTGY